jgi:hypothetical protein
MEIRNLTFGRPMPETKNTHPGFRNLSLGRILPFSPVNGSAAE